MQKFKAITFSFDDGNVDDIRLIEILNKYGLKATFNLSSGQMTKAFNWRHLDKKEVYHFNYFEWLFVNSWGKELKCL